MAHLRWHGACLYIVAGDVLEERMQVNLLLEITAQSRTDRLADNGQYRLVIKLGIVQAVQQMDRPGARCGEADSDLASELGVPGRHKRRLLFMPDLHELEAIQSPVERTQNAVDAVARIPID